jgi:L-iditol 2-dehydrogenase
MKAIQFLKPGELALSDLPDPEPPPGWARVRVAVAALCMTDFEVLHGSLAGGFPLTAGHEWSGIVDRTGSPEDEGWVGARVTGDNEITCLKCRYCRRGEWRRCAAYRQIGFQAPGAYAEYLVIPVENLHALPDTVSFEQGALLEPLGVGLAVARMAGARAGTTAAILGAGPIGLNCLAALKASGARRILCLEQRAARRALASNWGAFRVVDSAEALELASRELHPHGVDVVVEAAGSPDLLNLALRLVRFGGCVVLAGYYGRKPVTILPDLPQERNARLLGAGNNPGFVEPALEAVADGLIRTEGMITHRFTLEDYASAFSRESVERPGYIKGVFEL